jgi:indolepyruvate ferredoxin oxidoreductase alpha subunit
MSETSRLLLSGDEAVALAARNGGIVLGTGYPGTPSTEILESFSRLGGRAQWAPNEKVALEVGLGVAFTSARALVTMKHVGLNVAADPLFTAAYTGVTGALVVVSADDPGMASSQNEQDNRRYAVAAGVPMLEPADSQEAYDFTLLALQVSERWGIPVLLRLTTRVCHSKTVVRPVGTLPPPREPATFVRDIKGRVMIPAYARPAHQRLREKLVRIEEWNDAEGPNRLTEGDRSLGIITSGIAFMHTREAAPEAAVLKLGMTYPLPMETIRRFTESVSRCMVMEEGDPYLVDAIRAAGLKVDGKPEAFRFGELDVDRIKRIFATDPTTRPVPPPSKPPELCQGCPHRSVFSALRALNCIVASDIGCYTLAVLPPIEASDTCVCMGASIGVGLGLRHGLPPDEARRVVSTLGDSTFIHSGITGLVEMVYNPPKTGHLVIILDNGTTAMTGLQEHPGTGRTLDHQSTGKVVIENVVRSLGFTSVHVTDPTINPAAFQELVAASLASDALTVIVARRNCLLAAGSIKAYERGAAHEGIPENCVEQHD